MSARIRAVVGERGETLGAGQQQLSVPEVVRL
jgi:hypothetical protein